MLKSISLGGLIGGLVLFAWGVVSWMLLPWHLATLEKFKDEAKVAQALTANATKSGVYLLPNVHKHEPGMPEAKAKKAEAKGKKAEDRKSTRLNSSHSQISYAVFCLKKKKHNDLVLRSTAHPHSS